MSQIGANGPPPATRLRIALYQPDIAQNTGTILRLCACLATPVDLIAPAGFDISDRALKRAALDYLGAADFTRHASFDHFQRWRTANGLRLVLLTTRGETPYLSFAFKPGDILMLGRESAGVPEHVHNLADARIRVPMRRDMRSINVAVAAALVLGEAMRQTDAFSGLISI